MPLDGLLRLVNPVAQDHEAFIRSNVRAITHLVERGSAKGRSLTICGAGPTLRDHAAAYCPLTTEVWACNSALPFLVERGHRVTHGFCIDQTPEMLTEWADPPAVGYLVATSIHPQLREHLLAHGRKLRWFHNWVGINKPHRHYQGEYMTYEDALYRTLVPRETVRAGFGLNSVTRAIDVALYMGFRTITVLGADCALAYDAPPPADMQPGTPLHRTWLRAHGHLHANGDGVMASNSTSAILSGEIDGRHWETKADMMITAVALVKRARQLGKRLSLIGDTLPNALMAKDDAFLDQLPTLVMHDGAPVPLV